MASPQKENGFAPIANEILEALATAMLSALELRVVLYVLRATYGAVGNPKTSAIPVSAIARATCTGTSRAAGTVRNLIWKRVLVEERGPEGREARLVGLQKDHSAWTKHEQWRRPRRSGTLSRTGHCPKRMP